MPKTPWVPKELAEYPVARKVLGVLKDTELKEMDAITYRSLYREKVVEIVRRTPDYLEALRTHLRAPAHHWIPEKASPEEVVQHMEQASEWAQPAHLLTMHLKGKMPLKEVKERLSLEVEEVSLVKGKEFVEELNSLDLWEFLEMAV